MRLLIICLFGFVAGATVVADESNLQRGAQVFQTHCAHCHLPLDIDNRLRTTWAGHSAKDLYEKIKVTMPAEQPGALSDQQYIDAVSYALQLGQIALPDGVITATTLAEINITPDEVVTANNGNVDWADYNGNIAATRYSPLDQINAANVAKLEIAWRFPAGIFGPSPERTNVASPIVVDGTMYATAGQTRNVIAMDPATGQLQWMWRPQEGRRFHNAPRVGSGRAVTHWRDGARERIFTVTPGYFLVALNAKTGIPDPDFGQSGWIDLMQGLRLGQGRDDLDIGLNFSPMVVNDVVIVGSAHQVSFRPPSKSNVKGDVRGFDARTGKLLWTFKTIPEPGEPGSETWDMGSEVFTGNAGVWAPMSADPELGLVYLPVEAATGDRYGGDRPGNNLFANCLVALDIKTGEPKWYFQLIHHDIWDWDNPNAPVLADLPNGRKVVVQLTKQSFAYVFDRVTGEPIWPIEERPVPQTDVPGEWTSPTQPFPTRPAAYDRQGLGEDDLIDFSPALKAKALAAIKPFRLGPLYTPPSLANAEDGTYGTLSLPSATGGTNWEGGAYDPETGYLYVPSFTNPTVLSLVHDPKASSVQYICCGRKGVPRVDGLPLVKPPWGRITAIDLNSGDHRWQIANADTPEEVAKHPALKGKTLARTGIPTRSGLLVTKSLLFQGEGRGGNPIFRAIDKATGEIVAEIELPATQTGQPITYLHEGKQYIVMSVASTGNGGEYIALALP